MKQIILALSIFVVIGISLNLSTAQPNKPSSPPGPVKYLNKFEIVWQTAHRVLDEMGLRIELEDRAKGRIVTKPKDFIAGTVTASELEKIANKPEGANGDWTKGRYTIEISLEIIQPNETLVMVRPTIQGLKQQIGPTPSSNWVEWPSNGALERRVLGKLSMKLFSPSSKEDKKGFWDQSPQAIPSPKDKPRTVPSPERDRP
jgi:hypothetical protein